MFGMTQRCEPEERVDRREACVAGPRAVVTVAFEVLQEGTDELSVKVLQTKSRRCDTGPLLHEAEEETERVAVCGDRVLARLALTEEPLDEERLERWSERAHGVTSLGLEPAAARPSSSGAAERYQ